MKKLELYIHIPFCVKKCDYCDFLSAPSDDKTKKLYVDALIREIELSRKQMEKYIIDTVFIGGGTPSILDDEMLSEIMKALKANCHMEEDAEITIECNPGTVTEENLLAYKESGINRISFGLQSANDSELKSIGRIHNYAQFLESYRLARKCGFQNINIDLMSALPGQTEKSYKDTLEKIIGLNPEHISAYSLIVEEGTELKKKVDSAMAKGNYILPKEDEERRMYYMTKTMLERAGYSRYEISNYAKNGYKCRHNEGYWKRKEYLGFGIGAASLYKEERYNNIAKIDFYIEEMLENSSDTDGRLQENVLESIRENHQKLSKQEQMEEFMFLGLRMTEGISIEEFEKQFDVSLKEIYGAQTDKLISQRLMKEEDGNLFLTERGIDISNYVMAEFMF